MIFFDPHTKLGLLSVYMNKVIDNKPFGYIPFDAWMQYKYPSFVFGTPHYFRELATNCYYCQREFNNGNFKPTIDHFYPQSKDLSGNEQWNVIVISCMRCNRNKADQHPANFVKKFTVADMKGLQVEQFSAKDVSRISKNVNRIFNDILYGNAKTVYYKNNDVKRLPKGFIKIETYGRTA